MLTAWMAFAWSHPAFSADTLAPGTLPATDPIGSDASPELQPENTVPLSSTSTPEAAAPVVKPASSLRLAPIAIKRGGDIGYVIEQRTFKGGNAQLQQRLALNLRGNASSYIWQPWIAQVNGDLGFTANRARVDDNSSSSNAITGGVGLNLVPYSHYPFAARVSRNQQYTGPGIGSLTSQTTRLDLTQSFRPRLSPEFYQLGYTRSKSDSSDFLSGTDSEVNFNMTSDRFKYNSITADVVSGRFSRPGANTYRQSSNAQIHHRYRPTPSFQLENNASQISSSIQSPYQSETSKNRELNSTMSFQPSQAPYSVIGSARVHETDGGPTLRRSSNANLSAYYRYSQYVTLSASGNLNVSETASSSEVSASTTQSASANIPLIDTNLGSFRYSSQASGTITNRDSNKADSTQSLGLGVGHNLNNGMELGGGRLALGLGQTAGFSQSTGNTSTASTLTHNASTSWRRARGKSDTSLRLSGRDTRSLNRSQDAFQSIDFSATLGEEISRDSRLSGSLSVQTTRQLTPKEPKAKVFSGSSASVFYTHQRAFNVPRLMFTSILQTHSTAAVPVFAASPEDQGPITWENTLTYAVGKLITQFNANLSKESDGSTQSLISLSLKRYF